MKKILLILLGLLLPIASYAAPTTTYQRNLLPELTNTYNLGSSSNVWDALFIKNVTITGTCTGCSSGAVTSTLQDITTNGNTTTNRIQFAGGTSTAAFTVQGLLTAPTGSFTYTDATTTNATFATVGTLTASNATITNVSTTNLTATSSILQNTTSTNLSSTNLLYTSATGTNHTITNLTSSNVTITGGMINGTSIGATTPSTGVFTNATSTNLAVTGSITGASLSLSGALTVSGVATLATTTVTNFTASNTSTLATTTATTLSVSGATTLTGAATAGSTLAVTGAATFSSTLNVSGATTLATTTVTNFTASRTSTLATTTITSLSVNGVGYPSAAGSAGQIFRSNGTNFALSTSIWPDTTTINQILYSSSANTIAGITTANNGVLITSAGGVPSIGSTLPSAVQGNITSVGTLTSLTVSGASSLATTTVTNFTATRTSTLATTSITSLSLSSPLTVANGGTGVSSLTANGVLLGNGTSAVAVTATGTANQVLTSNGGATAPTFQAIPGATNGMSTLSGSVSISSTSFLDTGLSVTLPSAGTYLVLAQVRGFLYVNTGAAAQITTRFYNSTDSSAITNSEVITVLAAQNTLSYIITAPMMQLITVTGSKTIKLQAQTVGGTTFTTRDIQGDSSGYTNMIYVKVSN